MFSICDSWSHTVVYLGVNYSADKNMFFQNISIEQENSKKWIANIMHDLRL